MRSFGLVAVLILAGCTKPEPQPVASAEEPQPERPANLQSESPAPATQAVVDLLRSVELTRVPVDDDPTARIANCKLPDDVQQPITLLKSDLDAARLKYTDGHPEIVRMKRRLNALVQQALNQCVDQIQQDSPGHI